MLVAERNCMGVDRDFKGGIEERCGLAGLEVSVEYMVVVLWRTCRIK